MPLLLAMMRTPQVLSEIIYFNKPWSLLSWSYKASLPMSDIETFSFEDIHLDRYISFEKMNLDVSLSPIGREKIA